MDGDLISRKALMEAIDERERIMRKHVPDIQDDELRPTLKSIRRFVQNRPAVDAEPVRYGRWGAYHITAHNGLYPTFTVPCSVCAYESRFTHRYCPSCGAKMDVGDMKDGKID